MKFENQKLVRFVDEPIVNEQNERPFDLVINDKGIFLQVKCSSRKNCILRRAAATDAKTSGHPAVLNGRPPETFIPCV